MIILQILIKVEHTVHEYTNLYDTDCIRAYTLFCIVNSFNFNTYITYFIHVLK